MTESVKIPQKFKVLSSFSLKWIAIVCMLIDHIGAIFFSVQGGLALRMIGRLSFPIFCFLIVEGFYHTKSAPKYLLRLFLFALISNIPFSITFFRDFIDLNLPKNIFFTLSLGLLTIMLIEYSKKLVARYVPTGISSEILTIASSILLILLSAVAMFFLNSDYGIAGLMLILSFYLFRGYPIFLTIAVFLINFYMGFPQVLAVFALLPIFLYNGQVGRYKMKWFFYCFYPVHLVVLYLIQMVLG